MVLGPKDLAPFLTPFISANEWSDANARQLSIAGEHNNSIMRAQAEAAKTAAQMQANQYSREATKAYQQEQLALRKQQEQQLSDEKAEKVYGAWRTALDTGDDLAASSLEPLVRHHGFELGLDGQSTAPGAPSAPQSAAPAMAQSPLAPPTVQGVLRSFGAAPPAQPMLPGNQPHMSMAAPPASINQLMPSPLEPPPQMSVGQPAAAPPQAEAPPATPVAPEVAPQPRRVVVTRNGKLFDTFSIDQIDRSRQQQRERLKAEALRAIPLEEQSRAAANWEAANTMPGRTDEVLKRFLSLDTPEANRATQLEAAKYRNERSAAEADKRAAQASETAARSQSNLDLRKRTFARAGVTKMAKEFKVADSRFAVDNFRNALTMLNDAKKNGAKINNVMMMIAKSQDPSGRVSDRDYIVVPGHLDLISQGEDFIKKGLTGDRADKFKQNLRELIEQSIELNEQQEIKGYKSLLSLRDQQTDPVEWNEINGQIESTFSQRNWFADARADDKAYKKRLQAGQVQDLPPLAPGERPRLQTTAPATESTGKSSAPMPPKKPAPKSPTDTAIRRLEDL